MKNYPIYQYIRYSSRAKFYFQMMNIIYYVKFARYVRMRLIFKK